MNPSAFPVSSVLLKHDTKFVHLPGRDLDVRLGMKAELEAHPDRRPGEEVGTISFVWVPRLVPVSEDEVSLDNGE